MCGTKLMILHIVPAARSRSVDTNQHYVCFAGAVRYLHPRNPYCHACSLVRPFIPFLCSSVAPAGIGGHRHSCASATAILTIGFGQGVTTASFAFLSICYAGQALRTRKRMAGHCIITARPGLSRGLSLSGAVILPGSVGHSLRHTRASKLPSQ